MDSRAQKNLLYGAIVIVIVIVLFLLTRNGTPADAATPATLSSTGTPEYVIPLENVTYNVVSGQGSGLGNFTNLPPIPGMSSPFSGSVNKYSCGCGPKLGKGGSFLPPPIPLNTLPPNLCAIVQGGIDSGDIIGMKSAPYAMVSGDVIGNVYNGTFYLGYIKQNGTIYYKQGAYVPTADPQAKAIVNSWIATGFADGYTRCDVSLPANLSFG